MTTPITPNPAIHNDSINIQALEQAALQELTTLTQIFETFANQIILMVLNAVLRAFGLGAFAGPIDGVISELENLLEAIPSGNIQAILGSINLGADVQAIVDKIANALGIGGVGHDLATLVSALEAIPSGNITAILGSLNLGADVQAIVDKIVNALGVGGSNHTLSALLAALQAIPGGNLVGALTSAITAGGASDIVAMVQAVVGDFENVLPIVVPFTIGGGTTLDDFARVVGTLAPASSLQKLADTLYNTLLGNSALNWVSGVDMATLTAALHNVQTTVGSASNAAYAALSGVENLAVGVAAEIESAVANISPAQIVGQLSPSQIPDITLGMSSALQTLITDLANNLGAPLASVGATFTELAWAISNIPFANVLSPWLANIGSGLQGFADNLVGGLAAVAGGGGSGNTPTQVAQAGTAVADAINASAAIAASIQTTIANQAITNPASWGIDPTASTSFQLSAITNLTTAPTVNVTEASTVACYIDTPQGGIKQSIAWLGQITSSDLAATYGFYINLYSVNTSTNVATWVWSSNNLVSALVSSVAPLWNYANIPAANYVTTAQGQKYMAEVQIIGSSTSVTYKIVGIGGTWLGTNTSVAVGGMGCYRSSGPTINQLGFLTATAGTSSGTTSNPTWTHSYVSGDTVLVDIMGYSSTSAITAFAVTFGGITMTQRGIIANYEPAGAFGYVATYGLLASALGSLSTGTQTVAVATTGGGTSGTQCVVVGKSFSYRNISAFGTSQGTSGTSATPTQTVTGLTANSKTIVHSVLTSDTASASFGSPNQNNMGGITGGALNDAMLFQDQIAYATSIVFSGTVAGSGAFGGIATPLTSTASNPLQVPQTTFTPTALNNIPWMALCGAAGVSQLPAATKKYTAASTTTYTIPPAYTAAATAGSRIFFDVVINDGGAGGGMFANYYDYGGNLVVDNVYFNGGGAGAWRAVTLQLGVDIPLTTTSFTVTVGFGGSPGFVPSENLGGTQTTPAYNPGQWGFPTNTFAAPGDGGPSSVVVPGWGTLITGANGGEAGGSSQFINGDSPGDETFNGATYYGGLLQTTTGANGSAPGGGGACGTFQIGESSRQSAYNPATGITIEWFWYQVADIPGGSGAPGAAFITVYQA